MDFNEARDDWLAVASSAPYANYLHLIPDSTSPLRPDAFPVAHPALKAFDSRILLQ